MQVSDELAALRRQSDNSSTGVHRVDSRLDEARAGHFVTREVSPVGNQLRGLRLREFKPLDQGLVVRSGWVVLRNTKQDLQLLDGAFRIDLPDLPRNFVDHVDFHGACFTGWFGFRDDPRKHARAATLPHRVRQGNLTVQEFSQSSRALTFNRWHSDSRSAANPLNHIIFFHACAPTDFTKIPTNQLLAEIRPGIVPAGRKLWTNIAYDGAHLAFLTRTGTATTRSDYPTAVVITDTHGNVRFRFTLADGRLVTDVFLVDDELWLFDGSRVIDRYAMP